MMDLSAKLAVSTYALSDKGLEEAVIQLAAEGWKGIEIMGEGRHGEILDWPVSKLEHLRQIGRDHGIRWTIHAPITGINPAAEDEVVLRASEERLLKTLRIAERLHCAYVVVHPGEVAVDCGAEDRALAEERVCSFIERILQATEDSSVPIALENVPPYPALLGSGPGFLRRIARRFSSPRVGVVYDVGHAHLNHRAGWLEELWLLLPEVVALHLSDNHGEQDEHLALGAGTVPLVETLEAACSFGRSPLLVLETSSLDAAAESLGWLKGKNVL